LDEVAEFLEAGHDERDWLWDWWVQSWQHGNDFLIVGVFDDRPFWLKPQAPDGTAPGRPLR
jgi:hypothetical protein